MKKLTSSIWDLAPRPTQWWRLTNSTAGSPAHQSPFLSRHRAALSGATARPLSRATTCISAS
eukprot:3738296-Pleurochrysis_carterae.AAC.1